MTEINYQLLKEVIHSRPLESHKGNYGRVLTIGGNLNFGGAIIMSSSAAVHAGAGLVTCATYRENLSALHTIVPEAMFVDLANDQQITAALEQADVIVIGPGLGESSAAEKIFKKTLTQLQSRQFLIIDGSALTILSHHQNWFKRFAKQKIILTPHQMEWQRVSQIPIKKQTDTRNLAVQQELQATVVLKKFGTTIYHLNRTIAHLNVGGPYMATGGMGDTLTGIIAAFLGQFHQTTYETVVDAAVYTHSALAQKLSATNYVVLPSQIIKNLPNFMLSASLV
ncbi:NAD(P)H-hydrate dehydratase [Liquorilactobacillus vini]|uniref:ADP-dependent (S)-NAD(P)H-hydrate dehydratase n=1 Tax=Liquorilactobacillus vini DSM 20605 TaxID=1133569 RepID=A0A0R2CN19_9LACO|nr:NAD(P)H-hydrate dehydratase [Liquorilactobacillus vini]KRM89724.1 sugar kinase [Liquorilactobacillus vini DSM 20605]